VKKGLGLHFFCCLKSLKKLPVSRPTKYNWPRKAFDVSFDLSFALISIECDLFHPESVLKTLLRILNYTAISSVKILL